ncbi:hypothetical protein D3C81_1731510 [compost metagenome]
MLNVNVPSKKHVLQLVVRFLAEVFYFITNQEGYYVKLFKVLWVINQLFVLGQGTRSAAGTFFFEIKKRVHYVLEITPLIKRFWSHRTEVMQNCCRQACWPYWEGVVGDAFSDFFIRPHHF